MHIFCLTRGRTRSWRNGNAKCCQLNNIADTFSDFFSLKKAPKLYLVSENRRYSRARSCFPSTHTHTSLSLSLHLSAQFLFSTRTHISLSLSLSLSLSASAQFLFSTRQRRAELNSVKHRYYVACFYNFASIAKITVLLLSLSYGYFI